MPSTRTPSGKTVGSISMLLWGTILCLNHRRSLADPDWSVGLVGGTPGVHPEPVERADAPKRQIPVISKLFGRILKGSGLVPERLLPTTLAKSGNEAACNDDRHISSPSACPLLSLAWQPCPVSKQILLNPGGSILLKPPVRPTSMFNTCCLR
jgi:hypothetical protein